MTVRCLNGLTENRARFPIEAQNFLRSWSIAIFGGQCDLWSWNDMRICFLLWAVNVAAVGCLDGLAVWCSPWMQETGVRFPIEPQIFFSNSLNVIISTHWTKLKFEKTNAKNTCTLGPLTKSSVRTCTEIQGTLSFQKLWIIYPIVSGNQCITTVIRRKKFRKTEQYG